MQITPMTSSGLPATAEAIRRSQTRFDDAAAQVVQDTFSEAASGTASEAGATPTDGNLVGDLVAMKVDSLSNSILYGVFKRQSEQQKDLLDIISPERR